MSKGLIKIVNGLVFIFLDIHLGIFSFSTDAVPDFIGYIFVAQGCKILYEKMGKEGLKLASILAILLAVLDIVTICLPLVPGFQHEHLLSIIILLLHVAGYTFFNESMDVEGYRKDIGRMASLSLLAFSFLAVFRQFREVQLYEILMLLVGITVLMTGFTWFVSLNKLRRKYEAMK
ncbi:hypothetical protein EZV73_18800 [Acidaminobacter sp. JC074]|uniref:hypothetical protein n=1 Tax=Acidaminobacter sp. JC074 TaxID=2530199 RepID=UPI001F0DC63E|nr:hypothetical protein [Acidaminobacter sp. JC074]MCH4889639.1 hypothetical protein [Acidaminobacter sp. JC074]